MTHPHTAGTCWPTHPEARAHARRALAAHLGRPPHQVEIDDAVRPCPAPHVCTLPAAATSLRSA